MAKNNHCFNFGIYFFSGIFLIKKKKQGAGLLCGHPFLEWLVAKVGTKIKLFRPQKKKKTNRIFLQCCLLAPLSLFFVLSCLNLSMSIHIVLAAN